MAQTIALWALRLMQNREGSCKKTVVAKSGRKPMAGKRRRLSAVIAEPSGFSRKALG
jgi:hypothetical protein